MSLLQISSFFIYAEKWKGLGALKRKRRWGDRRDGRRLRTLSPISMVSPYIMKTRAGAQNKVHYTLDIEKVEEYIRKKRQEGLKNFGVLHVLVAAYIRTVSQRPAINRFISGQKIFARNNIETIMAIKMSMTLDAPDTMIKLSFSPDATAEDVYRAFVREIEANRGEGMAEEESAFDKTARVLRYIPGLLLKFTVSLLSFLDYFGLLPRFLTNVSPFHGSMVITSMGSLGIPPIYHHLYDFGNIPIFIAYGAKKKMIVPQRGTGEPEYKKFLDFTVTTDERICDGFYFASALKFLCNTLEHPEILDTPPAEVIADID